MIKKISKYILIILLFLGIFIFYCQKPVNAQAKTQNNLQILKLTPIISDINLVPGKKQSLEVKIENLLNDPLGIRLSLESLNATDELTGMQFGITDQNSPLLSWTSLSEKEFIIQEKSNKTITLTFDVPQNAKNGGYYAVLFATPYFTRPIDRLSPTVVSRVGAIFLTSIGKPDKEIPAKVASIETFSVNNVFNNLPDKNFVIRVKNNYPYHLSIKPFIEISPLFGQTTRIELEDKRVLPDKIRKWIKSEQLHIGIYQVKAAVSVGQGNYIYKQIFFVVFPIKEIAMAFLITVLLFGTFALRKRFLKALSIIYKG